MAPLWRLLVTFGRPKVTYHISNDTKEIKFSPDGSVESIYLDAVTPKVTGAAIGDRILDQRTDRYYYKFENNGEDSVIVKLAIEERFFEDVRALDKAPTITVYMKDSTELETLTNKGFDVKETIQETEEKKLWVKETEDVYTTTVKLPVVSGKETEYFIEVTYSDGSDNALTAGNKEVHNVADGIYTSPIIVLDDIHPVLTSFAFAGAS